MITDPISPYYKKGASGSEVENTPNAFKTKNPDDYFQKWNNHINLVITNTFSYEIIPKINSFKRLVECSWNQNIQREPWLPGQRVMVNVIEDQNMYMQECGCKSIQKEDIAITQKEEGTKKNHPQSI